MLKVSTKEMQADVAAYCRSQHDGKGIDARPDRLAHYRRLIQTIIRDALENAYPIANTYIEEKAWNRLMEAFIETHRCQHPQLFRMPEELISFVEAGDWERKLNIPYLLDLLRFDWLEVEVHTMENFHFLSNTGKDLVKDLLHVNPHHRLLATEYPIHLLKEGEIENADGAYYYLVFRRENGTVEYMQLTALTYAFLHATVEEGVSIETFVENYLNKLSALEKEQVTANFEQFVLRLIEKEVISY